MKKRILYFLTAMAVACHPPQFEMVPPNGVVPDEQEFPVNWYVSLEGSGNMDGSDWSNALPFSDFLALITIQDESFMDVGIHIKEGVYTIKPNQERILPKFLRYLLTASYIKTAYMKKAAGGTVKSVPMGEMRKLKIPVPSIEEQERIVSILDRFDALCNDISEGLPAEIEARQKQYEYYRDKLLTFKQVS